MKYNPSGVILREIKDYSPGGGPGIPDNSALVCVHLSNIISPALIYAPDCTLSLDRILSLRRLGFVIIVEK